MELNENQAALILTIDQEGEISVDVASPDTTSLPAGFCRAMALKLIADEKFQEELMDAVEMG
ncbi:hypothetical protein [Desulfogranum mediterraneum]|uniref:hypothetical protein n=1 Tax=Desulfogranum mediterraneum TaxID=160661 RepID=UPI000428DF05|nr:hypothetical protein [Desulfogranum mediterraneum]